MNDQRDILARLNAEINSWSDDDVDHDAQANINTLRAAISELTAQRAEIERLRTPDGARSALLSAITGSFSATAGLPNIATYPPQRERWETFRVDPGRLPVADMDGWEPFAATDAWLWFRRRVSP